jgi:outer membrane protein assembly factor BamB
MRINFIVSLIMFLISGCLSEQEGSEEDEQNWPQWRGPYANGIAPAGDPPVEWNEKKNVKWKVEIPGKGHATPVIWDDQIILLSAVQSYTKVETGEPAEDQQENQWMSPTTTNYVHQFVVISLDRHSGKIRWQTTVSEELPHSSTHQFGSWASNSPVTDGEHIYAYFGSHGLYCLNFEGNVIWERDFDPMEKVMNFGEGSSPVLYKDKLILLRDHEGPSYLHIIDKNTGEDILRIRREEISTWSTPHVVEYEGNPQVITSGTNRIRSYDLATGEVIWECGGMTRNVIPSPVSANGMVYLMSGFRGSALLAVNLAKAKGEITNSDAVVWTYDKYTSYAPSPLLMNDKLYFLRVNNGSLSCLDVKNGKEYYTNQRLEGVQEMFASPVGVKDRIYFTGANGTFHVIRHGPDFEVLSQNQLEDSFHASPVVVGNNLYLRGFRYLYCIAEEG